MCAVACRILATAITNRRRGLRTQKSRACDTRCDADDCRDMTPPSASGMIKPPTVARSSVTAATAIAGSAQRRRALVELSRSSGLTRKPSMPAARQASRSSAKRVGGQRDDRRAAARRRPASRGADAAGGLDAVEPRHLHVHQHEVVGRRRRFARPARTRPPRRRWSRSRRDGRAASAASASAAR